ncbi:hypothetical protein DOTSEDRAFT_21117 [Dothistroma septosporum NZE10]|uniref:Thioester reductase (TE) domain-containing protein n=1 Tax=Dothistroma septosporum (strain NZE10 / CBS 128990) TaxID=675120 RepID=N1PWF9_DOTSN|nr:hypothetical protein DOTSEDRAFT_21117 [Dothistroma septosporum NZE10]
MEPAQMWTELLVTPPRERDLSSDEVPTTDMASERTVFLLGATGFVGRFVLEFLRQKYPGHCVHCLLKNATKARADTLRLFNRNMKAIQGTLDEGEIVIRCSKQG